MRIILSLLFVIFMHSLSFCQDKKTKLLAKISKDVCTCIDSIDVYDKSKLLVSNEIKTCIDNSCMTYQLADKLPETDTIINKAFIKEDTIKMNVSLYVDQDSKEYKTYYYEMERYLMENCAAIKEKIASNDKQNKHSLSENPEALKLYYKGIDEAKAGNEEKAIGYYEKALEIDSIFAFAWDNIGLCYRRLNQYDKALYAYTRSLEIDPTGMMPLQNMAVVYRYKKEYENAIETYKKLSIIDSTNAEVFYGIGQIYFGSLNNAEKGLDNMCKAYNLYIASNSPYRTDAEKVIQLIYKEMKKAGNESRFFEILKENHISPEK